MKNRQLKNNLDRETYFYKISIAKKTAKLQQTSLFKRFVLFKLFNNQQP